MTERGKLFHQGVQATMPRLNPLTVMVAGLLGSFLGLVTTTFPFLEGLSQRARDQVLRHTFIPVSPAIHLVTVDKGEIEGRSFSPTILRQLLADLLDKLRESGAKAVALDFNFIGTTPSDERLAAAMRRHGKVVLGVTGIRGDGERKRSLPSRFLLPCPFRPAFSLRLLQLPPEPLLSSCSALGVVLLRLDRDGVIRKTPLVMGIDGVKKGLPSLALAAVGVWSGKLRVERDGIIWDGQKIFTLPPSWFVPVLLPPKGKEGSPFPSLPLTHILDGNFDPKRLRGKIVFVGQTGLGTSDIHPTPTDPAAFGVEIHAAIANTLLTGHIIMDLPVLWEILTASFLGVAFGLLALSHRLPLFLSSFALLVALSFLAPPLLVRYLNLLASPLTFLLSGSGAFFVTLWLLMRYQDEIRQWLYDQLSAHVSPVVAKALLQSPDRVQWGERREITVLFSDIRGFTPLSTSLSPYQISSLLSSYFTMMTEIVTLYGGVVDKFIGDGIMVLFGAVEDDEHHAERAVLCAWHMLEELGGINWEWERIAGKPLRIGIGINTGTAVVGNLGSARRSQFTALGPTVIVAQRLEELTKEFQASLLISASTHHQVADLVEVQAIEGVPIRGFSETPTTIYRVIGLTPKGRKVRRQLWMSTR